MVRAGSLIALAVAMAVAASAGPIHDAVRKGKAARVVALLSEKPKLVSSRDSLGNTPLLLAAKYNQVEIAELLLANGADVNAKNLQSSIPTSSQQIAPVGETALGFALLAYNHGAMLKLLLTHGADPNVVFGSSETPLQRAMRMDLPEDVQLLLANGANPNTAAQWGGRTVLLQAVMAGKHKMVEVLLAGGADVNARDSLKRTPLYYAEEAQDRKLIALLKAHGAHE